MALKKQTVWLLTMLSLVIVLSVYYVTAPSESAEQDYVVNGEESINEVVNGMTPDGIDLTIEEMDEEDVLASGMSSDDWFTALRMEINEQRSKMQEHLNDIVASADVTADKKSEALDQKQELQEMSAKEDIIEQLIRADSKYEDALVRADGNTVKVYVKAKEHSNAGANQIIRLVNDELGRKLVSVEFQDVN